MGSASGRAHFLTTSTLLVLLGAPALSRADVAETTSATNQTTAAARTGDTTADETPAANSATSKVSAPSGSETAVLERLIAQANERKLWRRTQWRRLGRWREGWLRGVQSEADGSEFFLSPRGAEDPAAELLATLRAFFAAPAGDDHAICRFPARLVWLQRELGFSEDDLPQRQCPKLERFLDSLNARSATLVFSSYYLSNAASAFGHTLLRINKQAADAGDQRRQLLDTGVNYSAGVDTGNALLYALKGLTGMFRGTFQRMPYYYKVREYNDFESRDLWEYELALTQPQLDLLVRHLWELGSTYFDYFYLSENCSYHVLGTLEVADPSIDLLSHVKWPVIPADTIKALLANPTFVTRVEYRPSLRTQFYARLAKLDEAERDLLSKLLDDPETPLPVAMPAARAAAALDAALDMLDLRYGEQIVTDTRSEPAKHKLALLGRRSALGVVSAPLEYNVPRERAPHRGHGSSRFGVGSGLRGARPFGTLNARLAMHDLADPIAGYPETSQLEFLPTELRFWFDDLELGLESTSLVRVVNLVPLTRYDRNVSWRLDTGARRIYDRGCPSCLTGFFDIGGGVTLGALSDRLTTFAMTETSVAFHPDLDGVVGPMRLGVGGSLGLRARLTQNLVWLSSGRMLWLPRQDQTQLWSAAGTLRWQYVSGYALSAEVRAEAAGTEAQLSLLYYY